MRKYFISLHVEILIVSLMSGKKRFYLLFRNALVFFAVTSLYGWIMRMYKVWPNDFPQYGNILQAHSHVAFLGWGFIAVTAMIIYLTDENWINQPGIIKKYKFINISLAGLLISFPIEGYKVFSIVLLTVFLIVSYLLLFDIYKRLQSEEGLEFQFMKTGILYYYVSSIALWAVPVIKVIYGKNTLYYEAVGFYMHFLYNGFFTLTLFGLICLYAYRTRGYYEYYQQQKIFYKLFSISIIPTFFLVSYTLRDSHPDVLMYVSVTGASFQLLIVLYGIRLFFSFLKLRSGYMLLPLFIGFSLSYILKTLFQFLASIPVIHHEITSYTTWLFIGYIHLFTLGFMSTSIFWLVYNFFRYKHSFFGLLSLFIGVIISELLLFAQGGLQYFGYDSIPQFDVLMASVSFLMPFGVLLVLISHYQNSRNV